MSNLKQALGLKEGESPFPWQEELLAKFIGGMAELAIGQDRQSLAIRPKWC
jgi:hypothetical protein